MNDPKDYSMLTQPKLKLNDTVIVWDEDEGGKWAQARVVDATFNRKKKCWEYSAVIEFVDEEKEAVEGYENTFRISGRKEITIKDWYCFSDEDVELWDEKQFFHIKTCVRTSSDCFYIVIKK